MFDLSLYIKFLDRGLLTEHEFCMLQSLDYYRDEYLLGQLISIPGRDITQRAGRCDLCGDPVPRGVPNFWSRSVGWVHFDNECVDKINKIGAIIQP